ncbi:hypothetical protein HOG21_06415 [bacterium]|jgi:hypothetical protein|nr:hypothetical protein [bacterium]
MSSNSFEVANILVLLNHLFINHVFSNIYKAVFTIVSALSNSDSILANLTNSFDQIKNDLNLLFFITLNKSEISFLSSSDCFISLKFLSKSDLLYKITQVDFSPSLHALHASCI